MCTLRVVDVPQPTRMRHRLAPVGEREVRIRLLRLLECFGRFLILEVVKELHATKERSLRCQIATIRKSQLAEIAVRRQCMCVTMTLRPVGIVLCSRDHGPDGCTTECR